MSRLLRQWASRRDARLLAMGGTCMVMAFFAGRYMARATPGGQTKDSLSFAGRLSGVQPNTTVPLKFAFKKSGNTVCTAPSAMADLDASGSFAAEIDISQCPSTLFDGGDVTYAVTVNGVALPDQPVDAVPYAKYADRYGSPDCPVGYVKDMGGCKRFFNGNIVDDVVKVGAGASAFWIDRYEATIWDGFENPTKQFGATGKDYPGSFPDSGQWTAPLYALSRPGFTPSSGTTWFQASEACRASGKRLPSGDEWLAAAHGTPDPTMGNDGSMNALCNTSGSGIRMTGLGAGCASSWGAQDMIGNLAEWTAEWFAAPTIQRGHSGSWPGGYAMDGAWEIASGADDDTGGLAGVPATALRGANWKTGTEGGVYFIALVAPSLNQNLGIGLRCVIPR